MPAKMKKCKNQSETYVDPTGRSHTDPVELSAAVFAGYADMTDEILDPDSDLKSYLRAHGLDDVVDLVDDYIQNGFPFKDDGSGALDSLCAFMAAYYLAILLDQNLKYPIQTDNGWEFVSDTDELLAALSQGSYGNPAPVSPVNQVVLTCPSLIVWLSTFDQQLAGKIQMLHDKCSDELDSVYYNSNSAYRIAYELNPDADLFFNTDRNSPDRCHSVAQVGEFLNRRLNLMALDKVDDGPFNDEFILLEDSAVGDYCRARGGEYLDRLLKGILCMDSESEYNRSKVFPYDDVVGAYKTVACFLGHAPSYPIGDKLITSPEQLNEFPAELLNNLIDPMSARKGVHTILESMLHKGDETVNKAKRQKLPDGSGKPMPWLYAWLSVFYQEDPKLKVEVTGSYERKTAQYTEFIGTIVPTEYYYNRYQRCMGSIEKATGKLRRKERSLKAGQTASLLLGGIPTVLVLLLSWLCAYPEGNPVNGHFIAAAAICCAACVASLSFGTFGGGKMLVPGLLAGAACAALTWAGFQWAPSMLYCTAGLALLVGGISACAALIKRIRGSRRDNGGELAKALDPEKQQLESLYFAYRSLSLTPDNHPIHYINSHRSSLDAVAEDLRAISFLWIPLVWMIAALWFFVTPAASGSHAWTDVSAGIEKIVPGQWALGRWEAKYASGRTHIVCNIDSVVDGKNIFGTMEIAGQAPVKARGVVRSEDDSIPQSFIFHPVEGFSPSKQEIDAEYSKADKTMTGYYYDRKGIMNQIKFISTPLTKK